MRRPQTILAALALLLGLAALPGHALAAPALAPAHGFAPRQLVVKLAGEERGRTLALPAGASVPAAAAALRDNPRVEYAQPNYVATASATTLGSEYLIPDDSGTLDAATAEATASRGSWTFKQWSFLPSASEAASKLPSSPGGIDVVGAWRNLAEVGRPGAAGVVVAVLDTGVAYRDYGSRFRRSPDFTASQFAKGIDLVGDDRLPLDENGHGTHVAGTVAEKTDNAIGLTGVAYGARVMPVRVLDRNGRGDAAAIAKGIHFAVAHGAQVINMSFNFGCGKKVPGVDEALREAFKHGVVAVASIGNLGSETCVSEPATGPRVIGVGGTTEGGCLGEYSLSGKDVDVVAPGGGIPIPGCTSVSARPIYQVTLEAGSTRNFSIPSTYVGTSMAAAHVSGVAAAILASGSLGQQTSPSARAEAVARRLRASARDIGLPKSQQGGGLVDAAAATAPLSARRR